jgi:hypothetical protein
MAISFLVLAAALQASAALPAQANVQRAVERLDMSSFRNSLANTARTGRARTLRQLGDFRFAWEDGEFTATQADGSWVHMFKPLTGPRGRIRLCYTDQAQNGGTYLTSQAIELTPGARGLYRARPIAHPDCERFAR